MFSPFLVAYTETATEISSHRARRVCAIVERVNRKGPFFIAQAQEQRAITDGRQFVSSTVLRRSKGETQVM